MYIQLNRKEFQMTSIHRTISPSANKFIVEFVMTTEFKYTFTYCMY